MIAAEQRRHYAEVRDRLRYPAKVQSAPRRIVPITRLGPIQAQGIFGVHRFAPLPTIIPVEAVIRASARHFMVDVSDIKSERRDAITVRARHVAAYLAKELTRASFSHLGRRLNRDHSTVMHGCQTIAERIKTDPHLAKDVAAVRAAAKQTGGIVRWS